MVYYEPSHRQYKMIYKDDNIQSSSGPYLKDKKTSDTRQGDSTTLKNNVKTISRPNLTDRPREFGYVVATHFSDQMTDSEANLVSFQCWASTLGRDVRVVEPFVRHSRLGVNLFAASIMSVLL